MFKTKLEVVSDKRGFRVETLEVTNIDGLDHASDYVKYRVLDYLQGKPITFFFLDGRKINIKGSNPRIKQYKKSQMVSMETATKLADSIEREINKLKDKLREELLKRPFYYISKEF
jgi:hypothetical protein